MDLILITIVFWMHWKQSMPQFAGITEAAPLLISGYTVK